MNKNIVIGILVAILILGGLVFFSRSRVSDDVQNMPEQMNDTNMPGMNHGGSM